jgi:hypothetical protein
MTIIMSRIKTIPVDLESFLLSLASISFARIISSIFESTIIYIISISLAFVPLLIVSYKLVLFLQKRNAFDSSNKGIKLSLLGFFIILMVFIPITLFNYLTGKYVELTVILLIGLSALPYKINLIQNVLMYINTIKQHTKRLQTLLLYLQIVMIFYMIMYLNDIQSPVTPARLDYLHLIFFGLLIMIPVYMVFISSKNNSTIVTTISIILCAIFLYVFLAAQNVIYFGGDTGFFISVTKYLLNGNDADFIPNLDYHRWRFGSAQQLGYPALIAYLAESSKVNPNVAISFANVVNSLYALLGAFILRNIFAKNEFEKHIVLISYLLAQPALFYYEIYHLRSKSFLLLIAPLIIPLFSQLYFNKYGKFAFIAGIFSISIIHPLAFIIILIMLMYLFKQLSKYEKIIFLTVIMIGLSILIIIPKGLKMLSVAEGTYITFTLNPLLKVILDPLPSYLSNTWSGLFVQKVSFIISVIILVILIFDKSNNIPRIPLIGIIISIFILCMTVTNANFPILTLLMFISAIGIPLIAVMIIRFLNLIKITLDIKIRLLVIIGITSLIMSIIVSSFPADRAFNLDILNIKEYKLLKSFIDKEKMMLNNSLIFAHIETMRYLNGLEGSILYYENAIKPFHFDFTDPLASDKFYPAFSSMLMGDFSNVLELVREKEVDSIYIVILYRLVGTKYQEYDYGDLIVANEAGMVRKISYNFYKIEDIDIKFDEKLEVHGVLDTKLMIDKKNNKISFGGTFVKDYTAVLLKGYFTKPINGAILLNISYTDSVIPRIYFIKHDGSVEEVKYKKIINGTTFLTIPLKPTKTYIHGIIISLDSGKYDQYGRQHLYPLQAELHLNLNNIIYIR